MGAVFTFVLHAHLPYVRGAGRWPHGEEWIHEAVVGTYLPLLVLLHDLRDEGVRVRLVLGLTPILLEQLADPEVAARSLAYLDDQTARARADAVRFAEAGESRRALVAAAYRDRLTSLREAYTRRFSGDLCAAFASLARSGELEILTSAATHGYLPLLDADSVERQLVVGRATTRRRLGLDPTGMWLPECAYRPGLEDALERNGITHFFTDEQLVAKRPTLRRTAPAARRSGDGLAPVPDAGSAEAHRPHLVAASRVVAIARDTALSGQVWSAAYGYPGDAAYREFHRKDSESGLRYWRVTGPGVELGAKAEYVPHAADARIVAHADHFVAAVLAALAAAPADALLAATFDCELFGHWWYEGVAWLEAVVRGLAKARAAVTTAAERLAATPPHARVALAEGSWGTRNDHSTWLNDGTRWMWVELGRMADALVPLRAVPRTPLRERAYRHALREILLAQSSDWPFLVTTGQAVDYAALRFRVHTQRFDRALEIAARGGDADAAELAALEAADPVFPDIAG